MESHVNRGTLRSAETSVLPGRATLGRKGAEVPLESRWIGPEPRMSSLVKRGMLWRAEKGGFPGRAPLGYRNVRVSLEKCWIEPDPQSAALVKEAFRLMARRGSSARTVLARVTEMGLRSRNGKAVQLSYFVRMLRNAFYVGEFSFSGRFFPGSHAPLVSRATFKAVQERLNESRTT